MAAPNDLQTTSPLEELLLQWQEARAQGRSIPAEELAASCPELLGELRERIAAVQAMEDLLGMNGSTAADGSHPSPSAALHPIVPGYEILDLLNEGGMGVVYRARQVSLNRLVALKMLRAREHARPDQLARFRREAEAVAHLRHPNVVQIYEIGEAQGQPFFSMEYVEGGSLAQRLARGPLPAHEAAQLLATLAQTIHAAHVCGIVHRDLKPGNILIAECGVRIADFGLAKHLDAQGQQTRSGELLGTPSYLAPEQAAAKPERIGLAADIYSLGAILYEMLTGRPPFQGESTLDTLEQVRSREPVPPSRLQPRVPRDLETICLKCLQKEPQRRYASAQDLADDLQRWLEGKPIHARPAGPMERLWRWSQRNPVVAGLTSAVFLLLATVAGVALAGYAREANLRAAAERSEEKANKEAARAREAEDQAKAEAARARAAEEYSRKLLYRCVETVDQHTEATITAKGDSQSEQREPGAILVTLASFYAAHAGQYQSDSALPADDRQRLADRYAARAVTLLERARELGYFQKPSHRQRLEDTQEFALLKARADYQDLLRRLR